MNGAKQTPPGMNQAEWSAFLEKTKQQADAAPKESLANIKAARDIAAVRFMEAAQKENRPDMKLYADLLSRFDGVDAELRAKKLGIDQGELLPRAECERMIFALGYWSLRATDLSLDSLMGQLKLVAPGLDGEHVRKILERELLSARFLEPFARASKIRNGVGLPDWFVAKMRTTCGDYLEKGEAAFTEIYGTDIR